MIAAAAIAGALAWPAAIVVIALVLRRAIEQELDR